MSFTRPDCLFHPRAAPGLLAIVLVLAAGLSRTDAADSSDVASEPVYTGLTVDGRTVSGRIAALSADRITLAGAEGSREEVPFRSLVKLGRPTGTAPETAEGSHLLFPDGDRLRRVIVGATTETTLDVQSHSALGKLTVPLDSVLGLVLTAPSESEAFDQLWDRVRSEPRSTEVVWLANGDRMTGGFLGMDDRAIKLQVDGKAVEIDRTGVVGLGFDPAVVSYPRPPSDFLEVTLSDGSRLGVTGAKLEKGQIVATTRFGQSIRFPIGDLVRLDPRTDAVAYLSERKVDGENYVAFLGPTRPFRVDRTVDGRHFQLGGQVYERGLGTQSRTLLAYKLKPGDRRFQALVGVDDRAGPLGSVVFRVLTDGQPQVATPPMTSRDTPRALDIDVSKAKLLDSSSRNSATVATFAIWPTGSRLGSSADRRPLINRKEIRAGSRRSRCPQGLARASRPPEVPYDGPPRPRMT